MQWTVTLLLLCAVITSAQFPNQRLRENRLHSDELQIPRRNVSEYEIISKLRQYPNYMYSDFMLDLFESGSFSSISLKCGRDAWKVAKDLNGSVDYAVRMVDSMGKPGSGYLDGNLNWYGSWDQCKSVEVTTESGEELFRPQYCLPFVLSPVFFRAGICVPDSCNEEEIRTLLATFLNVTFGTDWTLGRSLHCVHPVPWRLGDTMMVLVICFFAVLVLGSTFYELYYLPSKSKSNKETKTFQTGYINGGMTNNYENTNGVQLSKTSTISDTEPVPRETSLDPTVRTELNGSANVIDSDSTKIQEVETNGSVNFVGVESNGTVTVNGSPVVVVQPPVEEQSKDKPKPSMKEEILKSFSLSSNFSKMVNMTSTPKGMECLNGMRVLSFAWVVLGHVYIFLFTFISNMFSFVEEVEGTKSFSFIYRGTPSVDTFFFLSGFLVAFGTLKHLKKNKGRLNVPLMYLNRYIRLTPIYMFVIFFWMTIAVHLVTGPYESKEQMSALGYWTCYDWQWWPNLLYVNNFVHDLSTMCLGWSWYLANDMQFFIVSPIFVYALYRNRIIGYGLISAGILSNLLAIGIIYNKYELADPNSEIDEETRAHYSDSIYIRPYYRIAPYLVGIACADMYVNTKDVVKNMKSTGWKVFVVLMWIFTLVLQGHILYGYYPEEKPYWHVDLYQSTFRFAWSVGCAWVAYACLTGWGGFANTVLSFKVWEPLGRLCYLGYLLHEIVIYNFYMNLQTTVHANHWIISFFYVAIVAVTFGLAVVFFLLVEQPLGRLQRILLKK